MTNTIILASVLGHPVRTGRAGRFRFGVDGVGFRRPLDAGAANLRPSRRLDGQDGLGRHSRLRRRRGPGAEERRGDRLTDWQLTNVAVTFARRSSGSAPPGPAAPAPHPESGGGRRCGPGCTGPRCPPGFAGRRGGRPGRGGGRRPRARMASGGDDDGHLSANHRNSYGHRRDDFAARQHRRAVLDVVEGLGSGAISPGSALRCCQRPNGDGQR